MQVHSISDKSKTALQWLKQGYKVKRRQEPHTMWTNGYCSDMADYYEPSQVRPMTEQEKERVKAEQAKKRKKARERLKAERKAREKEEQKKQARFKKLIDKREQIKNKIALLSVPISRDLIVIDTETTGLNSFHCELLQVSIIDGDGNVLYDSYIKPILEKEWKEAERVNGISPEMVKNAPTALSELPKIAKILMSAKEVVGYNTEFDLGFLSEYGCHVSSSAIIVDVMRDFAKIYGEWNEYFEDYKWQKLSTCAAYYNFDWGDLQAHNSLSDCFATLHCYKNMYF